MKDKAARIEKAMGQVPISDRCKLSESAAGQKVMKELASHRHWGKEEKVFLDREGNIDHKRAADTYKKYREFFHKARDNAVHEEDDKKDDKKYGL